jgi:heptosyltransferase-3
MIQASIRQNPSAGAPLVMRLGALGDMILCTPLLRALAEQAGRPCDFVGRGAAAACILAHLDFVGQVRSLRRLGPPSWLSAERRRLVRWLREREPGPVILLETGDRSRRLLAEAGLVEYLSAAVTPPLMNEHVVDHHARVAGFDPQSQSYDRRPVLMVDDAMRAELMCWLKARDLDRAPLVLIQPGFRRALARRTRDPQRRKGWPPERWAAVIRGVLAGSPELRVLILGSAPEARLAEALARSVADRRVLSVADDLPLARLFALLQRAHSLISLDTGPAHAAAALGCPLVVLFGATDPRRNAPVPAGAPVTVLTGPPGADTPDGETAWALCHDMEGIAVDTVLNAWRTL